MKAQCDGLVVLRVEQRFVSSGWGDEWVVNASEMMRDGLNGLRNEVGETRMGVVIEMGLWFGGGFGQGEQ
ncbi:hypothetical protein V6N12_012510 [Hibiscus sabdariffa]|uniref:Uncharacterized protein n=1 Tax=Hibiscus sabdariffa TaxID=183260 RepID=A0ABR2AQ02_9ROSI